MSFKAFRIHQQEKGVSTGFEQMEVEDLTEGDVVVRVAYSGINFKDALAATGKAKILECRTLMAVSISPVQSRAARMRGLVQAIAFWYAAAAFLKPTMVVIHKWPVCRLDVLYPFRRVLNFAT